MKLPAKGHRGGRGITLDVTDEIINVAIPRDSSHCIVADALSQAVPDAKRISVDLQTIAFSDFESGRRYVYFTPAKLQQLLVDFDQGIKPEPFMIRLGQPAQIRRSGGQTPTSQKTDRQSRAPVPIPTGDGRTIGAAPTNREQPVVLGGKLPPIAALSNRRGRRRTFGIRAAKR